MSVGSESGWAWMVGSIGYLNADYLTGLCFPCRMVQMVMLFPNMHHLRLVGTVGEATVEYLGVGLSEVGCRNWPMVVGSCCSVLFVGLGA